MRICPNYEVNPIDVAGLYNLEKSLFGVMDNGLLVTPCEYFAAHNWPIADVFAGIFYLCWVPVPILFGLCLYFKKERKTYLRFALVFLFVNLIGFAGYYIHPAAPPWYAINYGFEPILNTPGNVAGLGRFDAFFGVTIFDSIYGRNANVFAAVPSLHAAYMVVALVYAIIGKCRWYVITLFCITRYLLRVDRLAGIRICIDENSGIQKILRKILCIYKVDLSPYWNKSY